MQTTTSHSFQEFWDLFIQLSKQEQQEVVDYMNNLIEEQEKEKNLSRNEQQNEN